MGKRLRTIYEVFSDYTVQEIDNMINGLSFEEKSLLYSRYGTDFHNPQTSEMWCKEKSNSFYGTLMPKMKKLLVHKNFNKHETTYDMFGYSSLLFQMLKEGKNNMEICEQLHITSYQLYQELLKMKNSGIHFLKTYYANGLIKYEPVSTIQSLKNYKVCNQHQTIITDENKMKVLAISDLHFGNELSRLDLIDRAYNYCNKNGIHIILCGGDLIDGSFTQGKQTITDLYKQIDFFIKNYPHDKNILTFSVAGDHDIDAFYKESLDIIEICENFRHDIIIGGYNNAIIHVKDDILQLFHHVNYGELLTTDAPIILHGHSHKFLTHMKDNALNINIPTLSEINQRMPSALELNLSFHKDYIEDCIIKHLYFGEQDIVLSELIFKLLGKNFPQDKETTCHDFKQVKTLMKKNEHLSQVEKFNNRYVK